MPNTIFNNGCQVMASKTPLYQQHQDAGAKLVDFAGWEMPLHYGSQLDEHHQVRQDAGMFDVSHMTVVDIQGSAAKPFLRYLLANDVNKLLQPGKALYSCMLNQQGGVVDDLIVYFVAEHDYRLVVNSGTRAKDLAWIQQHATDFQVTINPRPELAIIAVQGPQAIAKFAQLLTAAEVTILNALKPFHLVKLADYFIARTGYTGEDGVEIILAAAQANTLWNKLLQTGIKPCGLGARDTLRLEAGLNLYGSDMDDTTSPLESNLAWTVNWDDATRQFIGRESLLQQQAQGLQKKLVGLVLEDKGVLRSHQKVIIDGVGEGETTSGTFSPTLGKAIALARIPVAADGTCKVAIRGKHLTATIITPPFVRKGKKLV